MFSGGIERDQWHEMGKESSISRKQSNIKNAMVGKYHFTLGTIRK